MNEQIITVTEARRMIDEVYNYIETINAHVLSNNNTLDTHDLDNLRKSWEILRKLKVTRWTMQLM